MRSTARRCSLLVTLFAVGCGGSTTNTAGSALPDSGNGGSAGTVADSGNGGSAGTVADSGNGGSAGTVADSGTITTGRACTGNAECGAGYMCNTEAPGGYCMQGDPGGPTACREPDAPCTAPGSTCSPLPHHQIPGVCLRTCSSASDCRKNQICAVVELFPGDPSSPKSPTKVCWTACQPGMDQSCNDNPVISSLHGVCESDGTCTCKAGFAKNPDTGRCL
jgi:hypothetical protein